MPTTKRWAKSCSEVDDDDGRLVLGGVAARDRRRVGADQPAQAPGGALEPPHERADRAGSPPLPVHAPGAVLVLELGDEPAASASRSWKGPAISSPAGRGDRDRGGSLGRAARAGRPRRVVEHGHRAPQQLAAHALLRRSVSWLRMSEASAKQKRSRPSSTNACGVQPNTFTPSWRRLAARARAWSSRRGGAQKRTSGKPPGLRQAEARPPLVELAALLALGVPAVGVVEEQQVLALHVEDQHPHPPAHAGVASSRRISASAVLVLVATPLMPEIETWPPLVPSRKSRSMCTGSPSRPRPIGELALHRVLVERLGALVAGGTLHDLAGVGGDPDLGIDAGDRDASGAHLGGRHDAELRDPVRVGLVRGALVDRFGLRHDAVRRDLACLRHLGPHDDEVVELQVLVVVQHHAELARRRVLGTEDPSDAVAGHEASRSLTASCSARYTRPGSPIR